MGKRVSSHADTECGDLMETITGGYDVRDNGSGHYKKKLALLGKGPSTTPFCVEGDELPHV